MEYNCNTITLSNQCTNTTVIGHIDLISDAPSVQKYFENLLKIVGNYIDIAKQIDDNIYVRKNDSKQHKGLET